MMRSLWTAASGMIAQQTNVDTISNNIANVNTTGYKSERAEFKSLLYQTLQTKSTTANAEEKPIGAQVGLGARVAAISTNNAQGILQASDSDTDFAIDGPGYFAIGYGADVMYTRAGSFEWAVGTDGSVLTTASGNPVLDSDGNRITVPAGVTADQMEISSDGTIGYRDTAGTYYSTGKKIGLYQFNNPNGLDKKGDSLYAVTAASGNARNEATDAALTKSKLYQNYLEGSNVNVANEMVSLIIAQRAYELNSKAITASDEMLQQANNLRR
ncbi:MAG: flagellar hook-basal body protein [Lachnospiraceae bacterium]